MRNLKYTFQRNVLNIALIGDQKVGKSSIVKHFLNRSRVEKIEEVAHKPVNIVEMEFASGLTKKVIITEIHSADLSESNHDVVLDQKFDLICICYEHHNYLKRFIQEKHNFLRYPVPRIGVFCKSDERAIDRRAVATKEFEDIGLTIFAECSSKTGEFSSFTASIQKAIENPYPSVNE